MGNGLERMISISGYSGQPLKSLAVLPVGIWSHIMVDSRGVRINLTLEGAKPQLNEVQKDVQFRASKTMH